MISIDLTGEEVEFISGFLGSMLDDLFLDDLTRSIAESIYNKATAHLDEDTKEYYE